jgi:hypothetical protein
VVYSKGGGVQCWLPRRHYDEREGGGGTSRMPMRGKPTLRGILHGSRKARPNACGNVKPDMKPQAKAVSRTLTGVAGGREGDWL